MKNKVLLQLGLKEKEAAAYETLLPLGEVPVSDLTSILKEHPQIVYRLIESLEAKGLVIISTKKHRKVVRAEDPRLLEQKEARKLEELRLALPDLLALQKTSKDALVRLARGNEAVRSLRMDAFERLPEGGSYLIIGGSGDRFYEAMGDRNEAAEKLRIKRKIRKKLITFETQRKAILKREAHPQHADYRFLPEHFSIPTSTNIFGDTTAIIVWVNEPIVITIESAKVAEGHRHYFQALWKMAKA
jgi:sugar-specific transcriptional regulator TrmB